MTIEYEPIGFVRSPFTDPVGMPIQPSRARDIHGKIEMLPEYVPGLADLADFSHIVLLYHLHKTSGFALEVVPFLDDEPHGIFATRSPKRPNPIGLSVVELVSVENQVLEIAGVDILDGTPVLDIKPYVGEFDLRTDVRLGWFEKAFREKRRTVADDRFT